MKLIIGIVWIALLGSLSANAQNRLEQLEKDRVHYQQQVAEANTKPNGLHLRAVNEEIVNHLNEFGYAISCRRPPLGEKTPVQALAAPHPIIDQLRAGEVVNVYRRTGKRFFVVATKSGQIGRVPIEEFGNAIHEFPLVVLMEMDSPEETNAKEKAGVIEQKMLLYQLY